MCRKGRQLSDIQGMESYCMLCWHPNNSNVMLYSNRNRFFSYQVIPPAGWKARKHGYEKLDFVVKSKYSAVKIHY